jgi:hypothetical protein
MLRRRIGKPELDLDMFLLSQRSAPLLIRMNRERKDLAKIFYKAAVMHYAQENYLPLFFDLLIAVFLQPKLVIGRVVSKLTIRRSTKVT